MTNGHPYRDEDFDLYALGVLEGEERSGIESHLASCAECSRKLAEARGRVALLSLTAPPHQPSLAVRQRLLTRVSAEHVSVRKPSFAAADRPRARWWTVAWTFSAVAFALATIYLWRTNDQLRDQLAQQQAAIKQQIADTDRFRAFAALVMSPETVSVKLDPKGPDATEPGLVYYNQKQGALIYAGTLPQIATDKSYELWVLPQSGNPIPAGVFAPKPNGESEVVMPKIPVGVSAKGFAVTLEPSGGKNQPTGPMVQVGLGHQSL